MENESIATIGRSDGLGSLVTGAIDVLFHCAGFVGGGTALDFNLATARFEPDSNNAGPDRCRKMSVEASYLD